MEENYFYKRTHVPAFGSWDWDESLQFTQCFESARQAGLMRNSYSDESEERDLYVAGDLYENDVVIPAMIVVPRRRTKGRKQNEKDGKKQKWVSDEVKEPASSRSPSVDVAEAAMKKQTPKPVDEDLYKISPELLYAKTRKKRGFGFFSSCLMPICSV